MDNRRLLLLLVFCFSIFMLWDAWQKHNLPQPPVAQTSANQAASSSNGQVPAPTTGGNAAVPSVAQAAVASAPKVAVSTDLIQAEISSQGGDLVHLELLKHRGDGDTTKNFVLFDANEHHTYVGQSGLTGEGQPNHKTLWKILPGPQELKDGQDALEVRLEAAAADGSKVVKTYTFHRGSYLVDVSFSGSKAANAYFQLVRDGVVEKSGYMGASTYTGPAFYTEQDKFQKTAFEDIAKGKDKHATKADNGWVAMVQHYFVSAWLPKGAEEREFYSRKLNDNLYAAGVILPTNNGQIDVSLYAGPQEQDKLKALAPGLQLVVDYGWLTVIASPLFWVLEMLHKLTNNWGWSIILLTVAIKAVFFPLSAASYKSMAKMKLVGPKLQKLKELYADDRARLNQEMMELYKKEKINPLGGCLPILIQIPVFIALYWSLLGAVEMRHAPWILWITDLSSKDPYYVLPLLMGATMLLQTKLNPTPPDPVQAKVMMIMPIVFTGMFVFFPSGLVLYWTVNNLLSIAQQWQINRLIEGGKKAA
ncbi:MAG TPA: membrane protein insertase YidC [Rhodocyclaceae bacterium]|nr:membrane protein insertase YidC [Rhodocyclaceae bacterium]